MTVHQGSIIVGDHSRHSSAVVGLSVIPRWNPSVSPESRLRRPPSARVRHEQASRVGTHLTSGSGAGVGGGGRGGGGVVVVAVARLEEVAGITWRGRGRCGGAEIVSRPPPPGSEPSGSGPGERVP